VLLGLLVFSWLWFSCGPFTAMTWAAVVLASELGSRLRRRGRLPLTTPLLVLHGVAGLLLIVGAAGAVLGVADPAALASCDAEQVGRVLVVLAAVVGGSLLLISWPLRWLWLAWTGVMLLWCGRTGTDCSETWLRKGVEAVRGLAPRTPGGGPGGGAQNASSGGPHGGSPGAGDEGARSGEQGPGSGDGHGGAQGQGPGDGRGDGADRPTSKLSGPGEVPTRDAGGELLDEHGVPVSRPTARPTAPAEHALKDGQYGPAWESPMTGDADRPPSLGVDAEGDAGQPARPAGVRGGDDEPVAGAPGGSIDEALRDPRGFFSGERLVTLEGDLLFQFDESELQPRAEVPLRQLAKLLRLQPGQRVLIEGHADTIGGDAYNQTLSEERAAAVRTWLIDVAHINPGQLDYAGFGNSRPLVSASKSPAAQAPNRRVEVRVLP
jgi:outer membrane protein OmpA-like peptidoglycan-associated protein